MPAIGKARTVPTSKRDLVEEGSQLVDAFCRANKVHGPALHVVDRDNWLFGACAFYRPDDARTGKLLSDGDSRLAAKGYGPGINICVESCQVPAAEAMSRNWSWPGSKIDRTPYGVLAHELGHHADWLAGIHKGVYYSEYCEMVKAAAAEPGLTSYADENPAEWFAEAFRLFVTNPGLLRALRPRTYATIVGRWKPVGTLDWRLRLGANVPARVLRSLEKGARS